MSDTVEKVRSRTAPHLRTEVKDALSQIRESLDPDDRALLVLRIDRDMDWSDVARVIYPEEADRSSKDLARLSARLRKRFQLVKEEVREKARAAGLLSGD
jgi:RNA polymerase sigma-70 factor, ECF subfamily